ncbi:transcriptional regulator [Enterococcus sp. JM4C]|nr:transcriptional regulator [Enterococcus sp. JM4C]
MINYVKEFRKERKLTQEELAKLVNVSRQTIISLEKGSYVPSLELALDISNVFETNVEQVFRKERIAHEEN